MYNNFFTFNKSLAEVAYIISLVEQIIYVSIKMNHNREKSKIQKL